MNLNVNTHGKLHRIRHGEMKEKGLTYGGIPFEILPEEEGNSAVSGEKTVAENEKMCYNTEIVGRNVPKCDEIPLGGVKIQEVLACLQSVWY